MLLINIQRARAEYNDMLAEAEARHRAKSPRRSLIARVFAALRPHRATHTQ